MSSNTAVAPHLALHVVLIIPDKDGSASASLKKKPSCPTPAERSVWIIFQEPSNVTDANREAMYEHH